MRFCQIDDDNICFNVSDVSEEFRDELNKKQGIIILEGKYLRGIEVVDSPIGMQWSGRKWISIAEEDWSEPYSNEVSFEDEVLLKLDNIEKKLDKLLK